MNKSYVIFDMDGCLSDDSARLEDMMQRIGAGKPSDLDYEIYHRRFLVDKSMNLGVWSEWKERGATMLVVTARPERYRLSTHAWMNSKGMLDGVRPSVFLFMREDSCRLPSPECKIAILTRNGIAPESISAAFDDREDVLDAYAAYGVPVERLFILDSMGKRPYREPAPKKAPEKLVIKRKQEGAVMKRKPEQVTADQILAKMATTFRERNKSYQDNWKQVPELVKVLFPNGVPRHVIESPQWHLFELKLVKLSRFAISNLSHSDSIHDDAVYSAMIEAILLNGEADA